MAGSGLEYSVGVWAVVLATFLLWLRGGESRAVSDVVRLTAGSILVASLWFAPSTGFLGGVSLASAALAFAPAIGAELSTFPRPLAVLATMGLLLCAAAFPAESFVLGQLATVVAVAGLIHGGAGDAGAAFVRSVWVSVLFGQALLRGSEWANTAAFPLDVPASVARHLVPSALGVALATEGRRMMARRPPPLESAP